MMKKSENNNQKTLTTKVKEQNNVRYGHPLVQKPETPGKE
jgi:hypothetical protein